MMGNRSIYDKLIENRPNSINLNYAICNKDGETEFIKVQTRKTIIMIQVFLL